MQADSSQKAAETSSVMAAASPATNMQQEATCSICTEYMTEPTSVDCGHNFCRGCIAKYCDIWEGMEQSLECPLCKAPIRKRSLRPNWQLANIIEELKRLPLKTAGENLCAKHNEKQNLFCKQDEELVCVVCERSAKHKTHPMLLLEEAAQEYKVKIRAQRQTLEKERDNLVDQRLAELQRSQECLAELREEKQKVRSAFEKMEMFLEGKKSVWLTRLGDLEKEMEKRQKENAARLSEEISSLSNLIAEMEEKCQQPATEVLQDIRNTLARYQKRHVRPLQLSPDLEERLRAYSLKHSLLKGTLEKCEGDLERVLNTESVKQPLKKVNVTLDPDTASSYLAVSEDLKSVRIGDQRREVPDNPERFDTMPWVLGRERVTSGRHWWEVEVAEAEKERFATWAVGASRESVKRKGLTNIDPKEGIWAVGKNSCSFSDGTFRFTFTPVAYTSPKPTALIVRGALQKIRVLLDYEEGRVEFFDGDTNHSIFTFHPALFSGEEIRPFFWVVGGTRLKC